MIASIRAEQKINADAFSLLPNQITDSQGNLENFTTSSLVTIKTAGAGDCAFHASLGIWNETKKQFECEDAASERAKVANAIVESKPGDAIFPLISASLKELIVSGISVGENSAKATKSYQLYQQGYPQIVHCCWIEFEEELKNHIDIIKYMQQHASPKSKRLKEQFNDCESKDSDRFFRTLIASDSKLDKAYRHYQNACSESFVWDDILRDPSILQEYAEFIGTPGKWLLPSELHIIAIALNITIKFYNVNAAVEIYNPHQDHLTAVYYNGANHYEKIMASTDLSSNMRRSITKKGSFATNVGASAADPVTTSSTHATLSNRLLSHQKLLSSVSARFSDIMAQRDFYAPTTNNANTTSYHHHEHHHYSPSDLFETKDIKSLDKKSKISAPSPLTKTTAEDRSPSELKKKTEISVNPKETKQEIKSPSDRLALGASDFKTMRENGDVIVDKTLLIKEVIDDRAMVKLIIRPRRFGKTLNMSMLKCFFEEKEGEDRSGLFKDLKICADKDYATRYQIHQEKHPVIFLTFKDIKATSFKKALEQFQGLFAGLYLDYEDVLNKTPLKRKEIDYCEKIINEEANETKTQQALKNLVNYLCRITGKKPIILIDEYDTPVHASYAGGYYKEMAEFMRDLLSPALKDNADLEQAVLTGILRVAKESIFSGLNNIKVYSLLSERYSAYFGFSTEEVQNLLSKKEIPVGLMAQLEEWYGGYRIGKQNVMIPWSIVNFIEDNRDKSNGETVFKLHWLNTSENKLIEDMIQNHKEVIKNSFRSLVENKPIHQVLNEHTVFVDIGKHTHSLWSFLLLNGYLTHGPDTSEIKDETATGQLVIPNREVFSLYEKHVKKWFAGEKLSLHFENPFSQVIAHDWAIIRHYKKQVLNNKHTRAKLVFAEALIVHHRYIDADIINVIIKSLEDSNSNNQQAVYKFIMKAEVIQFIRDNETCISLLELSLDHTQLNTRVYATRVLLALIQTEEVLGIRSTRAPQIVGQINQRLLLALLSAWHADSDVRDAAKTALQQLTPKNKTSLSLLKAALAHPDFRIQISAAARLVELGGRDKSLSAIFLAALQHSEWRIREAGVKALGKIGQADEPTLLGVFSALHDNDRDVRSAAETAARQLTPKNKTSLSLLKAALTHPELKIQIGTAKRLFELGDRDKSLSAIFLAALQHSELRIREAGVKALREIGRADESTLLGVLSAWHDTDSDVRDTAKTALQQLTPKNEASLSLLKAVLNYPELKIKIGAAARLVELGDRDKSLSAIFLAALQHSEWRIREAGVKALREIGQVDDEPTLLGVLSAWHDTNSYVRNAAKIALQQLTPQNGVSLFLLKAALNHPEFKIQIGAAARLIELGDRDKSLSAIFLAALQHSAWRIREAGTRALGEMGQADASTLLPLLSALHDTDSDVRNAAERAVRQLTPKNEASLSLLKAVLTHPEFKIQIGAAARLIELGDRDKSLPVIFLAALQHSEWRIREAGVKALREIGQADDEPILLVVLSALHDTDSDVRNAAETAVKQLTHKNETGFSLLKLPLEHPDFRIQMDAAARLVELGDRDERLSILSLAALKHSKWRVRVAGVKALGEIGRADESSLLGVFSAWHDADYYVRSAAEAAVQQLTPKNATSFSLLKVLLEHPDFKMQMGAAARLVELGDRDERLSTLSLAALKHRERRLRVAGVKALGKIGRANESILLAVLSAWHDVDSDVRNAAERAVRQLTPKNEASLSLLKAVLTHAELKIQLGAAARLIELGDRDKSLSVIFLAALQHSEWRIREAGARALGEIGQADDEPTLLGVLSALHDTDSDVRRAAKTAVRQLTPKSEISLSLLKVVLEHTEFMMQMGAAARLVELGDRDERLSTLSLAALQHSEWRIREAGVKALGEIGRADESTLLGVFSAWHDADYHVRNAAEIAVQQLPPKNETNFSLWKVLLEHPDFRMLVNVATRLAELGDRDEYSFAILSAASRHSDYSIREAGERALEKINRANVPPLSPRFFKHRDVGAVAKTMMHSSIQENKAASSGVTGASSYSYEIMTSSASRNLDTRATSSQEASGVQVNPRTAYTKENEEEKPKRESGGRCVIS